MPEPMTLGAALALLAGTGRVRFARAPIEHQALKVVREALAERDARIAELTGECTCAHPPTSHEPGEYTPDGTPVRPICCATGCKCGDQWRNP